MAATSLSTRRERLRLIRADLQRRLDAGEFGPDLEYVCARGHTYLLWAHVSVLLGQADRIEGYTPAERRAAAERGTAEYVAGELERVWELVASSNKNRGPMRPPVRV